MRATGEAPQQTAESDLEVLWTGGDTRAREALAQRGARVGHVHPDACLQLVENRAPDLLVLSGSSAARAEEIVRALRARQPGASLPVIVISTETPAAKLRGGLVARLPAELTPSALAAAIHEHLEAGASLSRLRELALPASEIEAWLATAVEAETTGFLLAKTGVIAIGPGGRLAPDLAQARVALAEAHDAEPQPIKVLELPANRLLVLNEPLESAAALVDLSAVQIVVVHPDRARGEELRAELTGAGALAQTIGVEPDEIARVAGLAPVLIVIAAAALQHPAATSLWQDARLASASWLVLDESRQALAATHVLGAATSLSAAGRALRERLTNRKLVIDRIESFGAAGWLREVGRCEHPLTLVLRSSAGRSEVSMVAGKIRGASFVAAGGGAPQQDQAALQASLAMASGRVLVGPHEAVIAHEASLAAPLPAVPDAHDEPAPSEIRQRSAVAAVAPAAEPSAAALRSFRPSKPGQFDAKTKAAATGSVLAIRNAPANTNVAPSRANPEPAADATLAPLPPAAQAEETPTKAPPVQPQAVTGEGPRVLEAPASRGSEPGSEPALPLEAQTSRGNEAPTKPPPQAPRENQAPAKLPLQLEPPRENEAPTKPPLPLEAQALGGNEAPTKPPLPREPRALRGNEAPTKPPLPREPHALRGNEAPTKPPLPLEAQIPRGNEAPTKPPLPHEEQVLRGEEAFIAPLLPRDMHDAHEGGAPTGAPVLLAHAAHQEEDEPPTTPPFRPLHTALDDDEPPTTPPFRPLHAALDDDEPPTTPPFRPLLAAPAPETTAKPPPARPSAARQHQAASRPSLAQPGATRRHQATTRPPAQPNAAQDDETPTRPPPPLQPQAAQDDEMPTRPPPPLRPLEGGEEQVPAARSSAPVVLPDGRVPTATPPKPVAARRDLPAATTSKPSLASKGLPASTTSKPGAPRKDSTVNAALAQSTARKDLPSVAGSKQVAAHGEGAPSPKTATQSAARETPAAATSTQQSARSDDLPSAAQKAAQEAAAPPPAVVPEQQTTSDEPGTPAEPQKAAFDVALARGVAGAPNLQPSSPAPAPAEPRPLRASVAQTSATLAGSPAQRASMPPPLPGRRTASATIAPAAAGGVNGPSAESAAAPAFAATAPSSATTALHSGVAAAAVERFGAPTSAGSATPKAIAPFIDPFAALPVARAVNTPILNQRVAAPISAIASNLEPVPPAPGLPEPPEEPRPSGRPTWFHAVVLGTVATAIGAALGMLEPKELGKASQPRITEPPAEVARPVTVQEPPAPAPPEPTLPGALAAPPLAPPAEHAAPQPTPDKARPTPIPRGSEAAELLQQAKQAREAARFQEAEALLSQLLTQYPYDFGARYHMALTLVRLRRFDEAHAHLAKAMELNSESTSGWLLEGDIFLQEGRRVDALRSWNRCVAIQADFASCQERLARWRLQ